MAGYVEWDDVETPRKGGKGSGGGNSGKFLKLEANQEYTLRPLFKPVRYFKYFNKLGAQLRSAVVEDPDKCVVRPKYPTLKKPQERRGFLAFHREDGNKLKVVDGPANICDAFKHFKKISKAEPGGPEGGDFLVKVVCPNGVKDRDTTYVVEFVEKKPFTEEERKYIMESVKGKDEWDLEKIFGSNTPEDIEKRLFDPNWSPRSNQPQGGQQNAGAAPASPASSGGSTTAAPATDDAAFGW